MAYNIRWRRAVIVSVLCHIFIVAGAGYLSAQLLIVPVAQEQYTELELTNELPTEQTLLSTPTSPSPTASSQPALVAEKMAQTPATSPSATDSPSMVTTGELAVSSSNDTRSTTTSSANNNDSSSSRTGSGTSGSTGSTGKSTSIIPPSILAKVAPPYPEAARQAGLEGTVLLKIQIFENGRADNISISRSSGSAILDDAAIATIRLWRFVPAKDPSSGQAIPCYTTIPISFHLNA